MPLWLQLLVGFGLAGLVGMVAHRRGSLSRSGVAGAMLIGGLIFGLGGLAWALLLIAFFVSSSALSHFKETRKAALAEKFSKGHQRDLAQTLANGGVAAALAVLYFFDPHSGWWWAFVGALATVNADTWATELGVLHPGQPRLVTTLQPVEPGTSGGISFTGVLAALGGAALIGGLAALMQGLGWVAGPAGPMNALAQPANALIGLTATLGGLTGSLFDSWLGATVQAIYHCPACRKETERHPAHTCGTLTRHQRGWRWLDNDWVNALSALAGALMTAALMTALIHWGS